MEQIIQQIALELAKTISNKALYGGMSDVDALASDILKDCKSSAREIVRVIAEEMNKELRNDKTSRKAAGLVIKEKDRPRKLLTELGEISFRRDYYYCKYTGEYEATLDELLGIRPYARVGDNICAKLLTQATEVSYAKSSVNVTEGAVSRQTVHNIIKGAPIYKEVSKEDPKQVKAIHIYADEAHVHMQKPLKKRGRRNQIVPLVSVTEGIEKVSKRRNKTINPKHFVQENFSTKMLWLDVKRYIEKAYSMNEEPKVYIYGDGGAWIKGGLKCFSNSEYVIDTFHFEKYLRAAAKAYPSLHAAMQIHIAVARNDKEYAKRIIEKLKAASDVNTKKAVLDLESYMFSNWEAVVNSTKPETTGSCTEGQVSHILADRFSRAPMGWGRECLGKLANCRAHCFNGGQILASDFKHVDDNSKAAKDVAEEMLMEIGGRFDWSVFDGYEAGNVNAGTSYYRTENGGLLKLYS